MYPCQSFVPPAALAPYQSIYPYIFTQIPVIPQVECYQCNAEHQGCVYYEPTTLPYLPTVVQPVQIEIVQPVGQLTPSDVYTQELAYPVAHQENTSAIDLQAVQKIPEVSNATKEFQKYSKVFGISTEVLLYNYVMYTVRTGVTVDLDTLVFYLRNLADKDLKIDNIEQTQHGTSGENSEDIELVDKQQTILLEIKATEDDKQEMTLANEPGPLKYWIHKGCTYFYLDSPADESSDESQFNEEDDDGRNETEEKVNLQLGLNVNEAKSQKFDIIRTVEKPVKREWVSKGPTSEFLKRKLAAEEAFESKLLENEKIYEQEKLL